VFKVQIQIQLIFVVLKIFQNCFKKLLDILFLGDLFKKILCM